MVEYIKVIYKNNIDEDLDRYIKTCMTRRGYDVVLEKYSRVENERELKFVKKYVQN